METITLTEDDLEKGRVCRPVAGMRGNWREAPARRYLLILPRAWARARLGGADVSATLDSLAALIGTAGRANARWRLTGVDSVTDDGARITLTGPAVDNRRYLLNEAIGKLPESEPVPPEEEPGFMGNHELERR